MGGREEPASDRLKGTFGAGTTHQIIQRYCKLPSSFPTWLLFGGGATQDIILIHSRRRRLGCEAFLLRQGGPPSNQVGGNHRIWAVPPSISVHSPNGGVGAIGYS